MSKESLREQLKGQGFGLELIDYAEPDNRPKCFYYRKCGMQVGPWPCDPKSQKYYLTRGFFLEPPQGKPLPTYSCQVCGTKHDNLGGLIGCLKSHEKEEVDELS